MDKEPNIRLKINQEILDLLYTLDLKISRMAKESTLVKRDIDDMYLLLELSRRDYYKSIEKSNE